MQRTYFFNEKDKIYSSEPIKHTSEVASSMVAYFLFINKVFLPSFSPDYSEVNVKSTTIRFNLDFLSEVTANICTSTT